MNPGETFLGFDLHNHLWVVLSVATGNGGIAVANLTTHGRSRRCGSDCVIVRLGEHAYVVRDSCVYYEKWAMAPEQPLDEAKKRRTLEQREPFSPELLRRVQEGALASRFPDKEFKDAVRETLRRGR